MLKVLAANWGEIAPSDRGDVPADDADELDPVGVNVGLGWRPATAGTGQRTRWWRPRGVVAL